MKTVIYCRCGAADVVPIPFSKYLSTPESAELNCVYLFIFCLVNAFL
jgi:hypothetical protein